MKGRFAPFQVGGAAPPKLGSRVSQSVSLANSSLSQRASKPQNPTPSLSAEKAKRPQPITTSKDNLAISAVREPDGVQSLNASQQIREGIGSGAPLENTLRAKDQPVSTLLPQSLSNDLMLGSEPALRQARKRKQPEEDENNLENETEGQESSETDSEDESVSGQPTSTQDTSNLVGEEDEVEIKHRDPNPGSKTQAPMAGE